MLQATEFSFSSFSSSIQSSLFNAFLPVLIITHIFWDTFTSHGDKPSCIEETTYNLCFGDPLCRRLQKLVVSLLTVHGRLEGNVWKDQEAHDSWKNNN